MTIWPHLHEPKVAPPPCGRQCAVSDFEAPVVEAPVVFTLLMSLSPTFSAINLCLIYFLGLFGGLVALLETVARFLLFSAAQFS